jgi:hypothetical protein
LSKIPSPTLGVFTLTTIAAGGGLAIAGALAYPSPCPSDCNLVGQCDEWTGLISFPWLLAQISYLALIKGVCNCGPSFSGIDCASPICLSTSLGLLTFCFDYVPHQTVLKVFVTVMVAVSKSILLQPVFVRRVIEEPAAPLATALHSSV